MKQRRRPHKLTVPQLARMLQLRRAGLSCEGVAIVFRVDYGIDLSAGSVRSFTRRYGDGPFPVKGAGVSKNNGNFSGAAA